MLTPDEALAALRALQLDSTDIRTTSGMTGHTAFLRLESAIVPDRWVRIERSPNELADLITDGLYYIAVFDDAWDTEEQLKTLSYLVKIGTAYVRGDFQYSQTRLWGLRLNVNVDGTLVVLSSNAPQRVRRHLGRIIANLRNRTSRS